MASYILQPGNHVIEYPECGRTQPDDLPTFLTTMEPSFRKLLAVHPHSRSKNPEMIIEAFRRFLEEPSTQYGVPHWQVYKFGPCKWPYGKWLLHKLAWFIADPAKLLDALAELEGALEREQWVQMPMQEILVLGMSGDEEAEPEHRDDFKTPTPTPSSPPPDYSIPHPNDSPGITAWRKRWYPRVPDKREDAPAETDAVQAHKDERAA
jgi:hypothetical protein